MGEIHKPNGVLPITAAFTRYPEGIAWAKEKIEKNWGKIVLESPVFPFERTEYYTPTMGAHLKKIFFAMEPVMAPSRLAEMKVQSNLWEEEFAHEFPTEESRPLNIDPGYLDLGKLVLASSKDFYHRIYLDRGIYAEITLYYTRGKWTDFPWTFPDYREETYHPFFVSCRELLFKKRRGE